MLRPLAALLIASPAFAQEPSWPVEFNTIVTETAAYCEGTFSLEEGTVAQIDLNGDGTQDWLMDTAGFACSTAGSFYCGVLGCTIYTQIDGANGVLTLRSWEIVTDQGETFLSAPNQDGQTVRHRWTGTDWELPD